MSDTVDSTRRTLEQKRGAQAWADISKIKGSGDTLEKEYRSIARGLNAMIQINGLGQTLGFLAAKGKNDSKKAHYQLLQHLSAWMGKNFKTTNSDILKKHGLIQWITDPGTSSATYRRATTECMAFGLWLQRFAEAELKDPEPVQATENGGTPS